MFLRSICDEQWKARFHRNPLLLRVDFEETRLWLVLHLPPMPNNLPSYQAYILEAVIIQRIKTNHPTYIHNVCVCVGGEGSYSKII